MWRGRPVAHVYLAIDGDRATLQDIVVSQVAIVHGWMPWWVRSLRSRNFQRRGIGTRLLQETLRFARGAGARSIEGLITDESPWLIAWYERAGFQYDVSGETPMVRRKLDSEGLDPEGKDAEDRS